jgi:hypothetical protein
MAMTLSLSPENARRVRKLESALKSLREGEEKFFSITKLTSIKSLCRDEAYRKEYCVYLASLVMEDTEAVIRKEDADNVNNLIKGAQRVIIDVAYDNKKNRIIAEDTLSRLRDFQNQYTRVKWSTVRIIRNNDLLILENILQSLLSQPEIAPSYAYDATRNYVERYNPHYGTGLVVDSIPMLEKIIRFWKRYEDL